MCPERTLDWLAEAGGFEPLHLRSEFAKTSHSQDSNLCISKLVLVNFIVAQAGSSLRRLRRFLRVQPAHL